MTQYKSRIAHSALAITLLAVMALFISTPVQASPPKAPEKIPAVFIGDRLIDVAFNLGFLPEGMSLRCSLWPKCKQLKTASQVIGCPRCIVKKNPKALPTFLKERGIKRVIIERSPQFCIYMPKVSPEQAVKTLKGMDVTIEYVDFSQGVPSAIRQTAAFLNVAERGEKLVADYEKAFNKVKTTIPADGLNKRVIIINGIHQASTGKVFLRVEVPGGYSDQYILAPLGCTNVGNELFNKKPTIRKGHVMIRSLKGLIKAQPDVIVATGDSAGVQLALKAALKKNPKLAEVPAVRDMAVFSLPTYVDSGVVEYPGVFSRWQNALSAE